MIFGKLKLYAIAGLAGIAALGLYTLRIVTLTKARERAKDNERRLKSIRDKGKIEDEVDSSDDDDLIAGIVRKDR